MMQQTTEEREQRAHLDGMQTGRQLTAQMKVHLQSCLRFAPDGCQCGNEAKAVESSQVP